jgi:hypothetical protein
LIDLLLVDSAPCEVGTNRREGGRGRGLGGERERKGGREGEEESGRGLGLKV